MILSHHFSNVYVIPSMTHSLLFQMHNVKFCLLKEKFSNIFFQIKKKIEVAVKIHDRESETIYMAKVKLDNLVFNFLNDCLSKRLGRKLQDYF